MWQVERSHFLIRWLALLLVVISATALSQNESAPDGNQEIDAIWHVQSLPFLFRGRNVLYACAAFQKKLQSILLAVGAHPSMIIQTSCKPETLTDRVEARIALATPVEATPENIVAATTFDSKREFLARVQKTPLPTASAIEKFHAEHRVVSLEDGTDLSLEPSDCELLIAVKEQLFPKLDVQVQKSMLFCTDAVARPPVLQVRTLMRTDEAATNGSASAQDADRG
jgi:hypothetical protein